jgi:magnesium-transporting ATPase (P-type)
MAGDPLEITLLNSCGWTMDASADTIDMHSPAGGIIVSIIAAFEFSAELARMSTVVRVSKRGSPDQFKVLVKGSPESISGNTNACGV